MSSVFQARTTLLNNVQSDKNYYLGYVIGQKRRLSLRIPDYCIKYICTVQCKITVGWADFLI